MSLSIQSANTTNQTDDNKVLELAEKLKILFPCVKEKWKIVKEYLSHCPYINPITHLKELISEKKTAEFSKQINPWLDKLTFDCLKEEFGTDFQVDETNGQDFLFKMLPFEVKTSCSSSSYWTGNGYKKTPWHLLIKYEIENLEVIGIIAILVNLEKCQSKWTEPKKSANFSSLSFLNEDYENIVLIFGNMEKKQKKIHFKFQNI